MHILYTLSRSHRNFTGFFCSISLFFNSRNYKVNSSAKPYKVNIEIPIKLNIVNFKEVCNGGVACSRLQLGSLKSFSYCTLVCAEAAIFCTKTHVILVNDHRRKVVSFVLQKRLNIFLWCQIPV